MTFLALLTHGAKRQLATVYVMRDADLAVARRVSSTRSCMTRTSESTAR